MKKICKKCQATFTTKGHGQFCDDCHTKKCGTCGKVFQCLAKSINRPRAFCCGECFQKARWAVGKSKCATCGKPTKTTRYCSDECFKQSIRIRDRLRGQEKRKKHRISAWDAKLALMRELGAKCEQCGTEDFRVLEFHHKNPAKKTHGRNTGKSLHYRVKHLRTEKDNLRLLCANCHRIDTHVKIWKTCGILSASIILDEWNGKLS